MNAEPMPIPVLPTRLSPAVMTHTLHCIQDAVTIADPDDILVYVNPAFTRMYGYAPDEVIGQPSSMLWGESSASKARSEIFPTTMQLEFWSGELNNRHRDGHEFPIHLTTAQVRDEHGVLVALVGVARDITEQRQRMAEIARQAEAIEHANRQMRTDLLAAKRVQEVLLPPVENLERIFPEVLLLQLSNDVLASDLYWISQHLDRSFLALVDPGSHGVRAALASALLYGLFDQLVNERLVTQPEAVLEALEERVAVLLDQDVDRIVDLQPAVGFFSFSKNLRSARFAGVGVNMIIIRKGHALPIEPNPSLTSERKNTRPSRVKEFKVYNLTLQFGDTLYCYTPGVLQQLDETGKPWTLRELVNFLEGHQQLTMAEQARALSTHLQRRRGPHQAPEDGLIVGIRF